MSENTKKEDWQRLEITDVIDNPDGTSTLVFELEDEFREWFKKSFGLKGGATKGSRRCFLKQLEAIQRGRPEKINLYRQRRLFIDEFTLGSVGEPR